MNTYKILHQHPFDERLFQLEDGNGDLFWVDFYTDGAFDPPEGVAETAESWRNWLNTFVGKSIEIERITPHTYFSGGKTRIININ